MLKHFQEKLERLIQNQQAFILFRKPSSTQIELWENKKNKSVNTFICNSFDNSRLIEFNDDEVLEISVEDLPYFELLLPESKSDEAISYENYTALIHKTVDELRSNSPTKKIVISRINTLEKTRINLAETFKNLHQHYPNAYVYLRYDAKEGCWIGASPELLLKEKNQFIQTVSLAGTKAKEDTWTEKEYHEQQVVTDYITSTLKPYTSYIDVDGPFSVNAGFFEHLKSFISAQIKDKSKLYNLLKALHPTPAVGGMPKDLSKDFILQNEGYDRTFYAGFMGYQNETESEYFVNLRCAKIFSNKVNLYVGGGIMPDSIAENEWRETELKSKTIGELLIDSNEKT
ncbi:isochorismate synthase [Empedobacter brevis]|uniref:isochorismate synthase n=1 Tax=Empedobacter brevis TaxID=247 RepID=UPI0028978CB5|nr:isochorismate synthase [Empedobacter brevis]